MNISTDLVLDAVVHKPIKKYPIVFFDLKVSYEGSFDKAQVDILSNAASICEHSKKQLDAHVLSMTREEAESVVGCYKITDFDSENHIANIQWAEWCSDYDQYGEPVDDDEIPYDPAASGWSGRAERRKKARDTRYDDIKDYRESY